MSTYIYSALDATGKEFSGTMELPNQKDVITRIKEMGLYPLRINERPAPALKPRLVRKARRVEINLPVLSGRVKPKSLAAFTRQLSTLVDAGMPLLRSIRILEKQESSRTLKGVLGQLSVSIEGGSTFSEALAPHPKIFNRLFVNMVKAGEIGGVLDVVLKRLAEFSEKAQKIRGKVKAAMFYPIAVFAVAMGILALLVLYVIPNFKEVFSGMGIKMPAFTLFVLGVSDTIRFHIFPTVLALASLVILFLLALKTKLGRLAWDKTKLRLPAIGPVVRKIAISRFCRTLGTLATSGVPILQALTIVKETSGNVVVANAVDKIHASVKEGETITAPLESAKVFPPMVVGMVDVGEQTGALPEMLLRVADNYDEEVDNAVAAMTSLLEPIMIIFLAVLVGSIVIAMFLPLIEIIKQAGGGGGPTE
jgi:type IV pilus assembly protein PilC